jgi:hypothetical protein
MRIDKSHQPWMIVTLASLGAAIILYIPYAVWSANGPRGGSAIGLLYGVIGYALMLYAGLLGARKKKPVWRIGRAQTWMRGHLWLGLLSLPLILFHAGFAWRGPLTKLLMILFFIVVGSGILGAVLQHYVPHLILQRVPMETIYEQIPRVRPQLLSEADRIVESVCGPLDPAGGADDQAAAPEAATVAAVVDVDDEARQRFREAYLRTIRPFLENPAVAGAELGDDRQAGSVFQSYRRMLPTIVHPRLEDLENICEEERQLNRQTRLYQWLHGWLLVHVPLSIVLLVLGAVHAVMALRY